MISQNSKFKKEFIQRLIQFSLKVIKLAEELKKEKVFFSIIDQVIRSSTSIGANVVEAKSSGSKKDYIHFFEIALKSANETNYWLIIIREIASPRHKKELDYLMDELTEISNILAAGILTMKGKR